MPTIQRIWTRQDNSIPVENIELLGSEIFGAEIAGKNTATLDRIPYL